MSETTTTTGSGVDDAAELLGERTKGVICNLLQ